MREKKHIDRLFQEKFKDFEAAPSGAVWDNIKAQLKKNKKKRRVIPIWWRYAGVAAILILLLALFNINSTGDIKLPSNEVVDTESKSSVDSENDKNVSSETKDLQNNSSTNANAESVIANLEEHQVDDSNRSNATNSVSSKNNNLNTFIKPDAIQIVTTPKAVNIKDKASEKDNTNQYPLQEPNTQRGVFGDNGTRITNNVISPDKQYNKSARGNNVTDNIAVNKSVLEITKTDSSTVAQTIPNEINEPSVEELIDKDIKDLIEEEKFNRWSVVPNAAPVYFNSLGEGSSIDPQFNNNTKSGDLNMSYGIKASYALNKKLKIRSGINKVRLGYNTNNIIVYQSLSESSSNQLAFVSPSNSNRITNDVFSDTNSGSISIVSEGAINAKSASELLSSNTSINQEFGYIEIPLEIQYTLLDKKFGLNVIGGFSSFFLNENKIYSETSNSRTLLGEANNINNVSYSANLGLGVNYKISKSLDLNIEPLFKYQINTFSQTSGNFKPYFIGVYTGFAIKF